MIIKSVHIIWNVRVYLSTYVLEGLMNVAKLIQDWQLIKMIIKSFISKDVLALLTGMFCWLVTPLGRIMETLLVVFRAEGMVILQCLMEQ